MKLDSWFSADSYDCRFKCVRIFINKHIEFSFHQMGSVTNKMHQIRFQSGLHPRFSRVCTPDPAGGGHDTRPHL